MNAIRHLTFIIDEDLANEVDKAVESGDYPTEGEVIRQALYLWRRTRDADRAAIDRLKRLWDEGIASGDPIEGGFDLEDIKRRGRERLAQLKEA